MKKPKPKTVSSQTRKKCGYRIIGKNGWEDVSRNLPFKEALGMLKKIRKRGKKAIIVDESVLFSP